MTLKKKLASFALSAAMVASLTPAVAFADDAPAATTTTTSWVDLYTGMGLSAPTGEGLYDAVSSATGIAANKHYTHIPSVISQKDTGVKIKDSDKNAVVLDGVKLSQPASTIDLKVDTKRTTWSKFDARTLKPEKVYGTDKFTVYPDNTAAGYSWLGDAEKGLGSYKDKVYAVTISDGKTTVGALPWIDFYVENGHTDQVEIALNSGKVSEGCANGATVHRFDAFYTNGVLNPGTYNVKVYAQGYSTLEASIVVPTWTEATVTAADADADATSTAVTVNNLPTDFNAAYTVDGTAVTFNNGAISYKALAIGSHTLKVSDTNKKYNDLTATFKVSTAKAVADFDGVNKLVAAAGASADNFAAFLKNVTTVKIGDKNYAASGKGAVKVIGADGTIDLSATDFATPDGATLAVTVQATGAPDVSFNYVNKAAGTMVAKGKAVKVKAKKKATVKASKAFTVKGTVGKVTYKKVSGNKKITVASSGKITVKKGLKKGSYKIKVNVTDDGGATNLPLTTPVTVTVKAK